VRVYIRSDRSWSLQIPPAPPDVVWTGRLENFANVKTTALPRVGLSVGFVLLFFYLNIIPLVSTQAVHLVLSLFSLVLFGFPGRKGHAFRALQTAMRMRIFGVSQTWPRSALLHMLPEDWIRPGSWVLRSRLCSVLFERITGVDVFAALGAVFFAFLAEAVSAVRVSSGLEHSWKGRDAYPLVADGLHAGLMLAGLGTLSEITSRLYRSLLQSREEALQDRVRAEKLIRVYACDERKRGLLGDN
jgi:hypothetical protein